MLKPDDEICYCYHVTLRKLQNFARRRQLQKPSQMSECLGAGTGCGWCIPTLKRICADPERFDAGGIDSREYEARRADYRAHPERKHVF